MSKARPLLFGLWPGAGAALLWLIWLIKLFLIVCSAGREIFSRYLTGLLEDTVLGVSTIFFLSGLL
jgi:hypothetical protein